jgi:hypothetical protein
VPDRHDRHAATGDDDVSLRSTAAMSPESLAFASETFICMTASVYVDQDLN